VHLHPACPACTEPIRAYVRADTKAVVRGQAAVVLRGWRVFGLTRRVPLLAATSAEAPSRDRCGCPAVRRASRTRSAI